MAGGGPVRTLTHLTAGVWTSMSLHPLAISGCPVREDRSRIYGAVFDITGCLPKDLRLARFHESDFAVFSACEGKYMLIYSKL